MIENNFKKKVNPLTIYLAISPLLFILFAFSIFKVKYKKESMEDSTIKQTNIVNKNERSQIFVDNEKKQYLGMINEKELSESNILFSYSEGDRYGGLISDRNEKEIGFMCSVNQFKDKSIMQFQYIEK